ncbi:MAG: hypothetical protein RR320_01660 [Oscillospiraceae bacterium]
MLSYLPLSVGIIGGADGPTAIYLASSASAWLPMAATFVGAVISCALVLYFFRKKK